MMLSEKQFAFARLIVELIEEAYRQGYTVTLGEAWRPPETAALYAKQGKGIKDSLHTRRLALDINLFKDGRFLTQANEYWSLGQYWESLSTPGLECCWGGNFKVLKDACHFSISDKGTK